jgi:Flp pilus assembly protein TadG
VADRQRERGAGLFGTWFGLLVVLVLFLFAVQVLFDLYARSVVTATAYDAARRVAAYHRGDVADAEAAAESHAKQLLGKYGQRVLFTWDPSDSDVIRLHVVVENPRLGFGPFNKAMGLDRIDRTVTVRVERPQP